MNSWTENLKGSKLSLFLVKNVYFEFIAIKCFEQYQ